MTWLRNEDAALKLKFNGLTVADENAPPLGRPVAVRFRLPETELADASYPMIVIDPSVQSRAPDREHRGSTYLGYVPEAVGTATVPSISHETGLAITWDPDESDLSDSPIHVADFPVPYNLDYQVTVYARKQNHITELIQKLAEIERIPARFGYVEIPQDGTIRTMDLLGGPAILPVKDRDSKRLFTAVYSIRVVSELNLYGYTIDSDFVDSVDVVTYSVQDSTY